MGGTGVMMCVVLLILGVESSQAQAVCGSDGMCDFPGLIATPKSGTVIQVLCSYDNFVRCPAISWHTVFGASNYSSLQLGDYAGITTPDSTQEQCDVPSTGVFTNSSSVKRCGNTPVSIGAVGSKYVSVRQTFKPSTYFKSHNSSYVCWSLKNTAGQNSPQRCVYFQTVVRPNTIQISAPTFMLGSSTTVRISVGQTLRLRVWTYHVMEGVKADVDLKVDGCDSIESTNVLCPSPELPNQRWEGPTTCVAGNTTTTCERYLIYSPFKSEDKQQYRFALQAKLSNLAVTITSPLVASGVACGAKEGACAPAPYLDAAVTNYRVVVSTLQPVFASYDPGRILYTLPGVRTDPPVYTLPGTPVDGIELPKAFINCPLSGFGIYVSKEDANPENIDISFLPAGPGEPDAIARGVQVTRGYYAPVATGGDNPVSNTDAVDANTKYRKSRIAHLALSTRLARLRMNRALSCSALRRQQLPDDVVCVCVRSSCPACSQVRRGDVDPARGGHGADVPSVLSRVGKGLWTQRSANRDFECAGLREDPGGAVHVLHAAERHPAEHCRAVPHNVDPDLVGELRRVVRNEPGFFGLGCQPLEDHKRP